MLPVGPVRAVFAPALPCLGGAAAAGGWYVLWCDTQADLKSFLWHAIVCRTMWVVFTAFCMDVTSRLMLYERCMYQCDMRVTAYLSDG
jgi:hypothetical protein